MDQMSESPFIFGKIATKENFTNRNDESKRISQNIVSCINTILISPRRWGKSSLMYIVEDEISRSRKKVLFCFLDLFNIRTEEEFYHSLANGLLAATSSKWEDRIDTAKRFLSKIVPKFTLGLDPERDFSVSFDWKDIKQVPDEILNLSEKISIEKNIRLVVCIDEFQNIAHFDNPLAFQKKLRSNWQKHQHAVYCLYGSKRHLMIELFEHKSMPFYKFGDVIFLDKIDIKDWRDFIRNKFKKTGKQITAEEVIKIVELMDNHPYFVQQLSNEVWVNTREKCSEQIIAESVERLIVRNNILFQKEIDLLTNPQLNFLKAMCNGITQFSAKETLHEYKLGSSANVNRIKTALESKEVINRSERHIEFNDPLFKYWFSTVYMK